MAKEPRVRTDAVFREKVLEAIRRDLERDLENLPQDVQRLNTLEALLLRARRDQPNYRPVERELWLAYLARKKRYASSLISPGHELGASPSVEVGKESAGAEREQLWTETRELEGLLWGEGRPRSREIAHRIWSDEFWKELRESGVFPQDAVPALNFLAPRAVGRPITKRPLAVKALQLKMAKSLSLGQLTREVCDCGKEQHDLGCQDRLKKEMKSVTKILAKYGIPVS